jgi:hypothetical protein
MPRQTAGSNSYQYDLNGNMLNGAGRTLTWDANNRLSQATVASITTNFTYDDDGDRLKKTTGTSTSLYPLGDDDYEISGGVITKYFSMHGVSIATDLWTASGGCSILRTAQSVVREGRVGEFLEVRDQIPVRFAVSEIPLLGSPRFSRTHSVGFRPGPVR